MQNRASSSSSMAAARLTGAHCSAPVSPVAQVRLGKGGQRFPRPAGAAAAARASAATAQQAPPAGTGAALAVCVARQLTCSKVHRVGMTHGEATEAMRGDSDLAYSSASSEPATPPSDLEGAGAEPQRFAQEDGEGRTTPLTDEEPLDGEKRGAQPSTANRAKEAAEIMQMLGGSFHAPGLHGAITCTEATAAATTTNQTCRKRDREEDSCGPKLGMVWAPPAFRPSAQPMGWQFGLAPAPWAPNLPQRPAHVQPPPPVQRARPIGQRQGHSASVGAPPEPEHTICPMCQTDSSTSAADPGECLGGRMTPPEPGASEAEQGRQRRKRTMSRKRSCLRLGRWWKKYGYRGEPPRRPLRSYLFARGYFLTASLTREMLLQGRPTASAARRSSATIS